MIENRDGKVKLYGVIIGVIFAFLQHGVYLLAHGIATLIGPEPILPKIPVIDDMIPLVPVFIIFYVWSYLFWAMGPMAVSKCKLDYFLDFMAAELFAWILGGIFLIIVPTYMDRVEEGLLDAERTGFFDRWLQFWYTLDGSEIAYNLMPSFHCINSTLCYLGVCGKKEIPLWFRIYSLVMAVLIFASTLFVKQHYFIDVVTGIIVAVIAYVICIKLRAGRIFLKPIDFFKKLFSKKAEAN